ncbi:MAG TPA: SufD family Fe-S cluster assembly protein [Candidatus Limnocylindria bacterium]|nr:SufD family Fe-S cluster assembly protein [Candidatus Limnocylindria bacterium]
MAIDHSIRPAAAPAEREADWLRSLRASWHSRLEATPAPSGQEEEWRRTSLDGLPWGARSAAVPMAGTFDLPTHLAESGVVFGDLATLAVQRPELVQRFLGRRETLPAQAHFWALAHAEWQSGTFLYVPPGVEIEETLVARVDLGGAPAAFPVSLVVADEGSSVTLLEEIRSDDGVTAWFGGVSDVVAGPGARVRYASLQRLGDAAWNIGAQRVEVGQDAEVITLNAEIGSATTKLGVDVRMSGKGGSSRLLGLLAAGESQHIDINSVQDLIGSHTTSDLLYLSALYDQARAAFYGVTRVEKEAKGTSSYQECRNLLLSPQAGAEPIPVLEIETNDILRCGHGATAGAIDPVQLFYAQSRGLPAEEAERMIVRGFFEQVVAQVPSERIKAAVLGALSARIGSELDNEGAVA